MPENATFQAAGQLYIRQGWRMAIVVAAFCEIQNGCRAHRRGWDHPSDYVDLRNGKRCRKYLQIISFQWKREVDDFETVWRNTMTISYRRPTLNTRAQFHQRTQEQRGKTETFIRALYEFEQTQRKSKLLLNPKPQRMYKECTVLGMIYMGKYISHLAMLGGPLRAPTNWNSMDLGLSTGESILTTKGISYDIASIVILWRREANNCIYRCKQLLLGRSATPGTQRLLETCCILLANPH